MADTCRYRIFEAAAVLELFTSLERALASPTGETATDAPLRPVPQWPHMPRQLWQLGTCPWVGGVMG
jgi:hypothetical protein